MNGSEGSKSRSPSVASWHFARLARFLKNFSPRILPLQPSAEDTEVDGRRIEGRPLTSYQASGVEAGTCGLWRTGSGLTPVCTAPFLNASGWTRFPQAAIVCSTVNYFE